MTGQHDQSILKCSTRRLSNLALFICISCLFLLLPLTSGFALTRLFTDCIFTLIIVLAITGQTSMRKPIKLVYASIGFIAVVSTWLPFGTKGFIAFNAAMFIGFFSFSVSLFCHRLFMDRDVDADTLLGAACTYFLLGLLFASIYLLIFAFNPAAFSIQTTDIPPVIPLIYFSFVTLTTLGYGDILPQTDLARLIAVYEAIIGQIFGTVIVALLVGNYVARNQNTRPDFD